MSEEMISVAITDDHKILADGLERLINESKAAQVIDKAYSVQECLKMLQKRQPDVLLLDISMPDGSGIDLCRKLKELYPKQKIVMLTSFNELTTISRAMDAGADGYMLKNSMPEELIEGILTVATGGRYVCEEADHTLQENRKNAIELTRRELELLKLIADGYNLPQQADAMCLGYNTIRGYHHRLNTKLNAHNSIQLVQNAKNLNLL
ncbi:MAG: response regulator transcription factor [Candidatus Symbiothrix sp.]|jgi:DNA-binding NarL/FixJ family response regulator|nr:response regulator transcription factor [Candidatus Symbiothrix sp.]